MIFGPPSVGKMTVGRAICARSGFRLLHNHALLEPLLEVFDYGTPPFTRLLGEFRRRTIEEAAAAGTDLVLTFVWGLQLEDDAREVADYVRPYVERDVAWSDGNVREMEAQHVMSTAGRADPSGTPGERLLAGHRHLRLDNTGLSPEAAAVEILAWLDA